MGCHSWIYKQISKEEYDHCNDVTIEIDGKYYKDIYFDHIIRVYGYPEEEFTDVEKLIEWLEGYDQNDVESYSYDPNTGDQIITPGITDQAKAQLRKLWKDFDNKLAIDFG